MATGLDQAVVERENDGGGPVAEVELGEDVADVGLDGALAEYEVAGDLGVAQTSTDQREHLTLAWVSTSSSGESGAGATPSR